MREHVARYTKSFHPRCCFTRAFLPSAPLLTDEYESDKLFQKFKDLPHALRILQLESQINAKGKLNIERLMTRLDGRMPYDASLGAEEELALLLKAIKEAFVNKLKEARGSAKHTDELNVFAQYCVNTHSNCITFNYDDVLDEALWGVARVLDDFAPEDYWHPDGGYGFFLQNSLSCTANLQSYKDQTSMFLIKLHGSINWRVKLGHPRPYVIDAVVHHETWLPIPARLRGLPVADRDAIEMHLEAEPFIVPPVLVKSILLEQPILGLTWTLAYKTLKDAEEVAFLGYSLPRTDIAASFLFREALSALPTDCIRVVNLAANDEEKAAIKSVYREVFPEIKDNQFDFRGALEWAKELPAT